MSVFLNPPPILNAVPKFNPILRKPLISASDFRTFGEPVIVSRRSYRLNNTMAMGKTENRVVVGDSGDECTNAAVSALEQEALIDSGGISNHQTPGALHIVLNRLSKWSVVVAYGVVMVLRHDALALWAAMGSVLNIVLSVTLKQILNQERPVSEVSSGPGMPSSHAQSFSFAAIFMICSIVGWLGFNGLSAILSGLVIAIGVYFIEFNVFLNLVPLSLLTILTVVSFNTSIFLMWFMTILGASSLSWLRVLLRYHTTNQVVVGAVVGSTFSALWFWTWYAMVLKAYDSYLWVRIVIDVGAACFSLGFISHVLKHWTKDEH